MKSDCVFPLLRGSAKAALEGGCRFKGGKRRDAPQHTMEFLSLAVDEDSPAGGALARRSQRCLITTSDSLQLMSKDMFRPPVEPKLRLIPLVWTLIPPSP